MQKVKKYKHGFIRDPVCLTPDHTVQDVLKVKTDKGFTGIPITDNGQLGGKLMGIITARDIDFKTKEILEQPLGTLMTNLSSLVTAQEGITLEEAITVLERTKKGKLPIVDKDQRLTALISRTDIKKRRDYPLASKDANNQLLVGAAIGTREGDKERLRKLAEAGVDVVILVSVNAFCFSVGSRLIVSNSQVFIFLKQDSSQGNSLFQINFLKWIKVNFPNIQVIAGNGKCVHTRTLIT